MNNSPPEFTEDYIIVSKDGKGDKREKFTIMPPVINLAPEDAISFSWKAKDKDENDELTFIEEHPMDTTFKHLTDNHTVDKYSDDNAKRIAFFCDAYLVGKSFSFEARVTDG